MGLHNFDQNEQKLRDPHGNSLSTVLRDPQKMLNDIEQTRDTFLVDPNATAQRSESNQTIKGMDSNSIRNKIKKDVTQPTSD